jgi:hypothetical protein
MTTLSRIPLSALPAWASSDAVIHGLGGREPACRGATLLTPAAPAAGHGLRVFGIAS